MGKAGEKYTIEKHKHRFAAWAASRAAGVSPKCRFKVAKGGDLLESAGLDETTDFSGCLKSKNAFKSWHRKKRKSIQENGGKKFTDGVAAKLINVYLKVVLVCGGHDKRKGAEFVHPPIDSILLEKLCQESKEFKDGYAELGKPVWSSLTSDEYESVIDLVGAICAKEKAPLWKIEEYWKIEDKE